VWGGTRGTTPDKGRLLLEHMATGLCRLLHEVEATAWPPTTPQG
jgi:hypothetical protein